MKAQRGSTPLPVRVTICTLLLACAPPLQAYDWQQPTNKIVLLAINTHPDDEGIFFGGALPYYARVLQLPVVLLSMTSGGMSSSGTYPREDELRCAAWTYGLRYEPLFGRFADVHSDVLTNNPYTNTIDMTWDIWADGVLQGNGSDVEAGKARAINYVAEQIRRYRPDVIITHDAGGEYGHDNHKATAWAVTNAFFVAADPNATAPNLIGLPPWQAKKLYLHLYPTNRLFHKYWEMSFAELANQTARQVANTGLLCHVSQGLKNVGSVYAPSQPYAAWPSEWWGLYASTVGPDTVLSSNQLINDYPVPQGVAAGNFLEHLTGDGPNRPPFFTANPLFLPPAATGAAYRGQTLANYASDWSLLTWNPNMTLTFSKSNGPAWLTVAADGTLGGTPEPTDAGTNTWIVRVTDDRGLFAETTLSIFVPGRILGLDSILGWWRLDDPSPTILGPAPPPVKNWAPPEPDGAGYGGLTFGQSGPRPWVRRTMSFNGVDGKVDVPFTPLLNPPVFTVALWAKVTGGAGTYRSPLSNRKASPPAGYMFYAGLNDLWQFWAGNGANWVRLNAGPVVLNTWIHLAATYDGITVSFYTNGVLAASAPVILQRNDTFPLRIGAGATEGAGQYWFSGLVGDVRLSQVALNAAQVWALYANPPGFSRITAPSTGTVRVEAVGSAGQPYVLLAATNLLPVSPWTPISTAVADTNGYIQFIDPTAGSYPQRFYRLTTP